MNYLKSAARYFRAPFSAYKEAVVLGFVLSACIGVVLDILTPDWHWVLTALWLACSLLAFIGMKEWRSYHE